MPPPLSTQISTVPWNHLEAARLCREQARELALRYGSDPDEAARNAAIPMDVMLIVRDPDDAPIACGGIRLLDYPEDLPAEFDPTQVGEIKRMYVRPQARGAGIARLLLAELETSAASLGWTRLQLECGVVQPEALSLYESHGYFAIEPFGQYKWSDRTRCLAKNL